MVSSQRLNALVCFDCEALEMKQEPSPKTSPAETCARPDGRSEPLGFDLHLKIAAWTGGGGLLVLGLSPFFKWINFGSGGVTGISGDGKIVLGLSVLAIAAYIAVLVKRKWITPAFLGVQAWGTLAVFWMGSLIWKIGSLLNSPDLKDNPLAALIASQISPGAGLYLGLVGGLAIAGALGFAIVRRARPSGSLKPYFATQGLSCVLGALLAFLVGPSRPTGSQDDGPASASTGTETGTSEQSHFSKPSTGRLKKPRPGDSAAKEAARERKEYLSSVDLYGMKAKYYTSILKKRVPGVEFKLRNRGKKTLKQVEVTVYFKDGQGNVIAEDSYLPVLVSSYSFGSNAPLKPGYIWQMEKGKFYQAKKVPSEWKEGSVHAKVSAVEFASQSGMRSSGLDSQEKREYSSQIDLYDFKAKHYAAALDGRVPGVDFKLKNRGTRTLKEVEVTVYFKDAQGEVISEEVYHPVLVSDSSFSIRPSKPLKPQYIWQMESGRFYQAKSVPSEWKEGSAVAKITDLEFAEK
jgi:hypothetical protein